MVQWCNGEMVKWLNGGMVIWILNGEMVISRYGDIAWQYIVRSNMRHYTIIYFSKHLENIRESDLPDINALKTQI